MRAPNKRRSTDTPWGIAAGVAGSVLGSVASSAISGSGGGGSPSSGGGSWSPYVGAYQPTMDTNFNNNYDIYNQTLAGYYGQTSPMATGTLMGAYYNPFSSNYTQGAQQAQGAYYGAGQQAQQAGGAQMNLGQQLGQASQNWDANGQVLQNLQQQAGDTANAQSYLRGIQGSPYGASQATNAITNANLGYANTQLQNQIAAGGAASNAYTAGANLLGQGAGYYGAGSSLPYSANNTIAGNQSTALNNYYGTVSPYLQGLNQLQGNALQYLGYGNTSQNTAAGQASQAASSWGNLGYQAGTGLYNAYNNYSGGGSSPYTFTGGGGSMYSNPSGYDYYGSNSVGSVGSAFGY